MIENSHKTTQEILLMQPKVYPEDLISKVKFILANNTCVNSAYFSVAQVMPSNDGPDYLFALATNEDVNLEIMKIRIQLDQYNFDTSGKKIMFVSASQEPFCRYFSKTEPIYIRN